MLVLLGCCLIFREIKNGDKREKGGVAEYVYTGSGPHYLDHPYWGGKDITII
jgi:hypothetical protein